MAAYHSERMWQLAYELARSGAYRSAREVGVALQARGFPQAPPVLDNMRVREELDRLCMEARTGNIHALNTEGEPERSWFSEPQKQS